MGRHSAAVPGPIESSQQPGQDNQGDQNNQHGGARTTPALAHLAQTAAAETHGQPPIVIAQGLVKTYGRSDNTVTALHGINLEIASGQMTAIMGPSGSGKSTLLHCIAGLDKASSGRITVNGKEITGMSQRQLTKLRRDHIGFIFQSFNLVPTLTALENITLPLDIARRKIDKAHLQQVIDTVELQDRLKHLPAELSGGQQQRVACARALVSNPAVIFADEPTGNLDTKATRQIMEFLRSLVDDLSQSIVLVTHEADVASWADRVVFLRDGKIVDDLYHPTRATVLETLERLTGSEAR